MKKSVAMKWVEALRSGKYKKGKGTLRKDDKFCCLGVLCDISEKGRWIPDQGYSYSYDYPSEAVLRWSGLKTLDGAIDGKRYSLAEMNDGVKGSKARSHRTIADYIEKNWEQL